MHIITTNRAGRIHIPVGPATMHGDSAMMKHAKTINQMIQTMNNQLNRAAKRRAAIFEHPAYIWAIESDKPQWWAVELAASYNTLQLSLRREKQMGARLTFTKYPVEILQVTQNAALVIATHGKNNELLNKFWIPRSNVRSDEDRRLSEIKVQLETHARIKTHLHIVDWFARKEGILQL